MEGHVKRRSSILKPQQPLQIGSQEYGELSVTTTNLIKRRVSFHNMRTVQEFDQERNDITRSPQKEPIKLGDTGSSDGLHSTRASTFISTADQISVIDHSKAEIAGGLDKTVDNFLPMSASTPMPRECMKDCSSRFNTMLLFGPDLSFGPHGEHASSDKFREQFHAIDNGGPYSLGCLNDTNCSVSMESNVTHALFGPATHGYVENVVASVPNDTTCNDTFVRESMTVEQDDEITRQLFGLPTDKVKNDHKTAEANLFRSNLGEDTEVTDNLFKLSVCTELPKEDVQATCSATQREKHRFSFECDLEEKTKPAISLLIETPSMTENVENVGNCTTSDPQDCIAQTTESLYRSVNHSLRSADSPLAVLKKKVRLESPLKRNAPMPVRFNDESMELSQTFQHSSLHTPLHDLPLTNDLTLAEGTSFLLSPALQAIAKTKRYIRQSLDQSVTRTAPFSSPLVMLQDIMRPKHSISSMSDEQESQVVSPTTDQSCSQFPSILRSFANERMPEKTFVASLDESTIESPMNWNESCALTCRFDSVDFDIRIADIPCFQSRSDDHVIISRLRDVARRNICRGLAALNAEIEQRLEIDLKNLADSNPRLANAIKMLNPRKLSREEARAFEVCRFKAQKTWYNLRHEVAMITIDKIKELISERKEAFEKRIEEQKKLEKYRSIDTIEKSNVRAALERLRDIERLAMTGFEKNKVELASLQETIEEKQFENIKLKTEIAKVETEIIHKEIESICLKKQKQEELVSYVKQKCDQAKQFYLNHMQKLSVNDS